MTKNPTFIHTLGKVLFALSLLCTNGITGGLSALLASPSHALSFDGMDDKLVFSNSFILHQAGDATVAFWMKKYNSSHRSLIWSRPDATDTNRFNIYCDTNFGMDYISPSGVHHDLLHSDPLPDNIWVHIAIVRSGQSYTLYVNGQLDDTATDPSPQLPTSVGYTFSGRDGYILNGEIDEIHFWDAARTQSEIQTYLNLCVEGSEPNLFGAWSLNEGTGTTAQDKSQNNNDGTLVNGPSWIAGGSVVCSAALFCGGDADGFYFIASDTLVPPPVYSELFAGGDADGFHFIASDTLVPPPVYAELFAGGDADGFSLGFTAAIQPPTTLPELYSGGTGDGFSSFALGNVQPPPVYAELFGGGIRDGFSFLASGEICPPCIPDLVVSGMVGTGNYHSSGPLTSFDAAVEMNTQVIFKSDTSILLNFNFEVKLGAEFDAKIEPCEGGFN